MNVKGLVGPNVFAEKRLRRLESFPSRSAVWYPAKLTACAGCAAGAGMGIQDRDYYREGPGASRPRRAGRARPSGSSSITCGVFFGQCLSRSAMRIARWSRSDVYSTRNDPRRRGVAAAHPDVPARRICGTSSSTCSCCTGPGSELEELYGSREFLCSSTSSAGIFANFVYLAAHAGGLADPRRADRRERRGDGDARPVRVPLPAGSRCCCLLHHPDAGVAAGRAVTSGSTRSVAAGVGRAAASGTSPTSAARSSGCSTTRPGCEFSRALLAAARGRARCGRNSAWSRRPIEDDTPEPVGAAVESRAATRRRPPTSNSRPRSIAVLEKVSKHGQESLTPEEREILFKASELYKKRRK